VRAVLLIGVLAIAVPDREAPKVETVKPFQEQLLGEWRFVKVVLAGQDDPKGNKDLVLTFTKDVIHVRENGQAKPSEDAGYRIDATRQPIAFDITPKVPQGMKIAGIIKLEGDDLTICLSAPTGPEAGRPTNFASTPEVILMHLKRVKK
jgi:uncharacterized protein (TIGR03067 family)